MDYTMPAAILDSPDAEEERRRKAAAAAGLSMPPAVTPGSAAQPRTDASSTMTMPPAVPPATTRSNASADASAMPPAFYAGVNARPREPETATAMPAAGYADKYKELAAQEPNRADYPAQPMPWWKKALGLVSAAAGGLGRKDDTTFRLASDVLNSPQNQAEKNFEQAHKTWQEQLGGVEKESGLANTSSEIAERDARTQALLHPKEKEQPDKIAYHYTNDQGQEVSVFEDGTEKVGGKAQAKPPASDTNKVAPEIEAQIGPLPKADPKNPTAPVQWNGKTYPSERAAQQAWGHAAEQVKNREAASSGAARFEVLNQGKAVNVIRDGQLVAIHPDDLKAGDVLAGAGAGMTTMSKEGQFNEIHSGIDSARTAITQLDKPFSAAQIGKLTLAMRHSNDPNVFRTEIETMLGSQELTPAQQDFVIAIGQLNERALSLRNIAGMGQGSEQMRAAIQAVLPGVKSGSKDMALKQLKAFENQVQQLEKGVPKMPGSKTEPARNSGNFVPF